MGDNELKYYLNKLECSYSRDDNLLGDTLLLAGAGGGKTTTLINRVNGLIALGITLNNILVLTFTRKSAQDFRTRVGSDVFVSTFHGFAFSLLKNSGKYFKILTNEQQYLIENYLRHEKLLWYSECFFTYENYLSFNGIIERLVQLLKYDLVFKNMVCSNYQYILVDEYQDSDSLQIEFLQLLNSGGSKITVAGDDSQSIYSFRGGSYKNILLFKRDFPYGKLIKFEKNYRSTVRIVNFSNNILKKMQFKFEKKIIAQNGMGIKPKIIEVATLHDEGEYLALLLKKLLKEKQPSERVAVIYRNKNLVEHIEKSLWIHGVPYNMVTHYGIENNVVTHNGIIEGDKKILSTHDLLILEEFNNLKIFVNRINYINLEKIRYSLAENEIERNIKTSDILEEIAHINNGLYGSKLSLDVRQKIKYSRYFALLNYFITKENLGSSSLNSESLPEYQLIDAYKGLYWDKLDLKWRLDIIQNSELETNTKAVTDTSASADTNVNNITGLHNHNCVDLITAHSSKGLEWDYVFLTSFTEGVYPSVSSDIEEELRILYVGCSRSRKELTLIAPQNIHWFLTDFHGTSSLINGIDTNSYLLVTK